MKPYSCADCGEPIPTEFISIKYRERLCRFCWMLRETTPKVEVDENGVSYPDEQPVTYCKGCGVMILAGAGDVCAQCDAERKGM